MYASNIFSYFYLLISQSKQIYKVIKSGALIVARDDCSAFSKNVGPTWLPLERQLYRSQGNTTVGHRSSFQALYCSVVHRQEAYLRRGRGWGGLCYVWMPSP